MSPTHCLIYLMDLSSRQKNVGTNSIWPRFLVVSCQVQYCLNQKGDWRRSWKEGRRARRSSSQAHQQVIYLLSADREPVFPALVHGHHWHMGALKACRTQGLWSIVVWPRCFRSPSDEWRRPTGGCIILVLRLDLCHDICVSSMMFCLKVMFFQEAVYSCKICISLFIGSRTNGFETRSLYPGLNPGRGSSIQASSLSTKQKLVMRK